MPIRTIKLYLFNESLLAKLKSTHTIKMYWNNKSDKVDLEN